MLTFAVTRVLFVYQEDQDNRHYDQCKKSYCNRCNAMGPTKGVLAAAFLTSLFWPIILPLYWILKKPTPYAREKLQAQKQKALEAELERLRKEVLG
jgi:hypothetical protein